MPEMRSVMTPGHGRRVENGLTGCFEELESRRLLPPDLLALCCVGSVARGWANAGSDYDFNVVSRTPWRVPEESSVQAIPVPLRPDAVPMVTLFVGGRRWEVKYWLDAQVDQMLGKVGWEQFEKGGSGARALIDVEELFLERLATCLPLGGAAWVRDRRRELDGTAFRAFVTTRSLAAADEAVEDALGQLAAGDCDSAVLSARKAFGHVADALMESEGNFGSLLPKWRARRFREAPPGRLAYEEYWRLETMRGFSSEAPERWVRHVVRRCKDLSLEVEIR